MQWSIMSLIWRRYLTFHLSFSYIGIYKDLTYWTIKIASWVKIFARRAHRNRTLSFKTMAGASINFNVATTAGIAFCSIFTGANLCMSNATLPTLLFPPPRSSTSSEQPASSSSHLARQWQNLYNLGSKAGPVIALGGATSFIYAARGSQAAIPLQARLLYAAAGLCLGILPFTLVFMKRTNDELHRRANIATKGEEPKIDAAQGTLESRTTPDLLQRWAGLNLM